MRPSELMMMLLGVVFGLLAIALGIYMFIDRDGDEAWFYWIAPLLSIGFGVTAFQLVAAYYMKVGRLEMKGRPRR